MANSDANCFTVVWEDASEMPSTQELRQSLEKGTDEVKIDTLRKIIVATLNGSPQVRTTVPFKALADSNVAVPAAHAGHSVCNAVQEQGP